VVVLVFYLTTGYEAAVSASLGAMIFIVPQQYFAIKSFRYMGARAVFKTVQTFYRAESTKLILTACGFALVFSFYKEVDVFALMMSFSLLVIINGVSSLIVVK